MNREDLRKNYLISAENLSLSVKKEERLLIYISLFRLICFIGGIFLIVYAFLYNQLVGFLLVPFITFLFLYLLKLYSAHSDKKDFIRNLELINRREAEALIGNLSGFEQGGKYMSMSHDFSYDVDLFGESSLFQYLNRTVTGYGSDVLAGWLSDPFILSHDMLKRQEIIRELAVKEKFRHEFMASGMKVPLEEKNIAGIIQWMDEKPVIGSSSFKKFLMYFLPSAALLGMILLTAGLLHYSFFVLILLINLAFVTSIIKKTNRIHQVLSGRYAYLSSMNNLLKAFANESFTSEYLNEIRGEITGADGSAAVSVRRLSRLIQSFDSRLNLLVGFFLNALLLWDFHCLYKLEKWKDEYKRKFPMWLETLGKVDAFVSLANYAFNNQSFSYPVKSDSNIIFSSRQLGHPLIDESKRINNDFSLDEEGSICIITGANMAGKSTFLRTVAVNYILGMTGSPVCAKELVFTPRKLFTSMRTTDSLSGNESYFYAELKRLKILKTKIVEKDPVFFILDEILKGTNSADKTLGSGLFIKKLMLQGGTGLIATHDISIGELEKDYPGRIINMSFEIEIDGEIINFDYKLNHGITRKMNAALLMKQMGILD